MTVEENSDPDGVEENSDPDGFLIEHNNVRDLEIHLIFGFSLGACLPASAFKNKESESMGDSSVEVSEENRDASQEAKGKAMEAISDGKFEEAIEHLTDAILLNPTSVIMYNIRAIVYIKMKKPNAAIRDADTALQINPDSAKGYRSRGIARAMLGQWEEAAKDLHVASKLYYDEEISSVLKVEHNADRIEEHRRKYDKLRKEREDRKLERARERRKAEAKAAHGKAKKQKQASSSERTRGMPGGFLGRMSGGFRGGMPGGFRGGMHGGMPGGVGGMSGGFHGGMPGRFRGEMPGGSPGGMPGGFPGGMPGGGMPGGMPNPAGIVRSKILNDPELVAAFRDPDVMTALLDVEKPAYFARHKANPKVAAVIAKTVSKFGAK